MSDGKEWEFGLRTPVTSSLALCKRSFLSCMSGDACEVEYDRGHRGVERNCKTAVSINTPYDDGIRTDDDPGS